MSSKDPNKTLKDWKDRWKDKDLKKNWKDLNVPWKDKDLLID